MDTVIDLNTAQSEEFSLHALWRLITRALLEPARFFRQDLPRLSFTGALAFGIGNAWVAAVLAFFVQTLNSFLLANLLEHWMQRLLSAEDGFQVWTLAPDSFLFTSGALLLAPFLFLVRVFFLSAGLFLFSRVLIEDRPGAPEKVTFAGAMRIESVALTSHWFSLVPIFGGILSFIVGLVLTVTGVRERFGVSNRRATAVVLAPYALFLLAVLIMAALLLVALTQVPFSDLIDFDPRALGN